MEDEATWLRGRIIRLRGALRFTKEARVDVILREVIADAEDRLSRSTRGHRVRLTVHTLASANELILQGGEAG